MMNRLTVAVLCAGLMGSAMAVDEGNAPAAKEPLITVLPAVSAASEVPAAHPSIAPETSAPETSAPQANPPASKSSIPLDKRQGGDATKCLELKSNQEIAACAAKYH